MQNALSVSQYLSGHHIRPSFQRVRIFQYLEEHRTHPTVDEIYVALAGEIPTLSRTTVYNTLDLFVHEQIAQPLSIEDNQLRYDADTSMHGHFQCRGCGRVFDFAVERLLISGLDGFCPESRNVFFKGICPACLQNGSSEAAQPQQPDKR